MNRVILLGRVGGDPEVKEFTDTKICKFSLATTRRYKKDGDKVENTTWHNLVFFGFQCDTLKEYVHKGDQLLIEGEIQTRQYEDKNKVKHWATEIVCDRFELLGSKKGETAKEEKWQGKKEIKIEVKAMSNIDDLPQNVRDDQEVSENLDLPF